jgi:hypothetical protein
MSMSSVARKRRSEMQPQSSPQVPTYNPNINSNSQQSQSLQQQQQQQQQKPMGTGLTLPQVISVIDTRLIHLESFMKETKTSSEKSMNSPQQLESSEISSEFIEEVQTRFDILAREISDLKDVILKLQSFTMEVNKSLLEERIHILSDLGENKMVEEQDV